MPRTTAWLSTWLAVALGLGACRNTEEVAPDTSSEYIDLYLDDGFQICGRQLAAYDRFIERVFSKWTQSDPGDFRVQVHVLHETDCNTDVPYASCASRRKVQLAGPNAAFHELVHAVTQRTDGSTVSSIMEGIAEALGPGDPVVETSYIAPFEQAFMFKDRRSFASGDYAPARFWTATLIERHGMADFREYYRAMGQIANPGVEDYELAFGNAFGEPLETAWASFLEEPGCVDPFQFCDMAEEIVIPHVVQDFECGDPQTLGYVGPPDTSFLPSRTFKATVSREQQILLEIDNATVIMVRCDACGATRMGTTFKTPIETMFDVEAGTYVFMVRKHDVTRPTSVTLSEWTY